MKKNFLTGIAIGLVMFGQAGVTNATALVQYSFTSDTNPSTLGAGVQSSSYDDTNLNLSYIGTDGFGKVLEAYPSQDSVDYNSAVTNDSYFSINVNASSGSYLDLETLQFEVAKGGSADPRGYFVRSSVDGFSGDLFSTLLPSGPNQAPTLQAIDLSTLSVFQHISSIDFRFYIFTPDSPAYINYSVDFRNLALLGNISEPVPEPATILLFGTGLAGLLGTTLRRKKKEQSKVRVLTRKS
ncbi:MAG: hypothetical protein ACJA0N_000359 [Pseudohongiellaceae bacterium]|jgi:hypothetical protein